MHLRHGRPPSPAVHPHACGEHHQAVAEHGADAGSSPRLWGTFKEAEVGNLCDRFIPTPVGNIRALSSRGRRTAVHPHACGEHFAFRREGDAFHGSSPRLWGTSLVFSVIRFRSRFIPTPVGNIFPSCHKATEQSVHPHACGEHILFYLPLPGDGGSSPRLWGTWR